MGQTLSNADSALREFYEPGAREQLNNEIPILAQIEKNTEDIEGRRAVLSLHVRRNSGVGARADGGTLPTAGYQGYAEERIPVKYNYGVGAITGPTIRAMKSNRGSFVRAVDSEMKGITNDLKRDVCRQAWGNADAKIATCTTSNNSAVVSLATTTTAVQMRQFSVGMVVDIGTAGSPSTVVSAATISAIDATAGASSITIDSAITTSGSHFVFRSGNAVDATHINEITGLQAIVKATGTLHNVNPSTYPDWVSAVRSNSGTARALSENLMAQSVQDAYLASGEWPNLGACSEGTHRAFAALLTSQKRFPGTIDLKGGYKALDFTAAGPTIPVALDKDCPAKSIFWLNTSHLTEYQESDWEFMQEDGAVLSRTSGKDEYGFVLFKYHELATDRRNAHSQLQDITEA